MSAADPTGAPQLGDFDTGEPTLGHSTAANSNGLIDSATLDNTKDTVQHTTQSTMDTLKNNPVTQNAKDVYNNSVVGQSLSKETAKASSEFSDLANAGTPQEPAATGQPLTRYHSMFYRLLSWKNPRATGITFAVSIILIFAARYLNIIRYIFKGLYLVLGVTAAAEAAGKAVLGNGLTSQMRPRKYFVIPKESLERFLDDFQHLINFFVIEFQRIVFAENVYVTAAAFVASFISYWLIKILPLWGLTLLFTIVLYLTPLIYITNKEAIDEQLEKAGVIINQQAAQVRDLAAQHTGRAAETVKASFGDYSAKAQELVANARQKARAASGSKTGTGSVKSSDFPTAPKTEPATSTKSSKAKPEPIAA